MQNEPLGNSPACRAGRNTGGRHQPKDGLSSETPYRPRSRPRSSVPRSSPAVPNGAPKGATPSRPMEIGRQSAAAIDVPQRFGPHAVAPPSVPPICAREAKGDPYNKSETVPHGRRAQGNPKVLRHRPKTALHCHRLAIKDPALIPSYSVNLHKYHNT